MLANSGILFDNLLVFVVLYPNSLQPAGFLCLSAGPNIKQVGPSRIRFQHNTCITVDGKFYQVDGLTPEDVMSSNNSLLSIDGSFDGGPLSAWQQQGFDAGSRVGTIPAIDQTLQHARRLLQMPTPAPDMRNCTGQCGMYISGAAARLCTSPPESVLSAADELGFSREYYVPRPTGGWEAIWHCDQSSLPTSRATACNVSAQEESLLLKVNWPHHSDSPDEPWEQPLGCKGGLPVNAPGFTMADKQGAVGGGPASVGITQRSFGGGIEGHDAGAACGGRGILYSSKAIAARTDPTAQNASAMWWMCGEFDPRRAMAACAKIAACKYLARHESANDNVTAGGTAVHLDPTLDNDGCITCTSAPSSAGCPDPAL